MLFTACKTPSSILMHNSEETWGHVKYDRENTISDTAFLMFSNRHFTEGTLRFADNQTDTSQSHLLYICKKNNLWHVQEINSLAEGIAKFPQKNWVLYTEGMGKIFTSNIERAYLMSGQYDVNVILFDYASIMDEKGVGRNYRFARTNSAASHKQYARFLAEIAHIKYSTHYFDNVSISIFVHSLGNAMFRKMMMEKEHIAFGHKKFIDNVILNASCVSRKNHHRWVGAIDFAKRVYINFNRQDRNLNGATFLTLRRMLGCKPKYPFAKNAMYIDFNEAVGKEHSYFLNFPFRHFVLPGGVVSYFSSVLNGQYLDAVRDLEKSNITGNKIKQ